MTISLTKAVRLLRWPLERLMRGFGVIGVTFCGWGKKGSACLQKQGDSERRGDRIAISRPQRGRGTEKRFSLLRSRRVAKISQSSTSSFPSQLLNVKKDSHGPCSSRRRGRTSQFFPSPSFGKVSKECGGLLCEEVTLNCDGRWRCEVHTQKNLGKCDAKILERD